MSNWAAYLIVIDPRYKGLGLDDDEIADAFDYIVLLTKDLGLDEGK
jgi:hypothetical protein